jgi:hypothetical protein
MVEAESNKEVNTFPSIYPFFLLFKASSVRVLAKDDFDLDIIVNEKVVYLALHSLRRLLINDFLEGQRKPENHTAGDGCRRQYKVLQYC